MDVIYPRENEKLYNQIVERGVILSEYALGTPPLAENFPRRNRILSGLSLGIFVVEAHSRSGSLITAHQAVEQGREVFALPGPVNQLTSKGTHQLLKEGAALVENPEDILEVLSSQLNQQNRFKAVPSINLPQQRELSENASESSPSTQAAKEQAVIPLPEDLGTIEEVLHEEGPLNQDEILDFTGMKPAELFSILLRLELAGRVKRSPHGKYALC